MFLHALHNLRDGLLSLAYPQACRLCLASVESWNHGIVCAACWNNPQITRLFCHQDCCDKCGLPLPTPQHFSATDEVDAANPVLNSSAGSAVRRHCGRCEGMPFAFARACGAYAGALEANVLFLKSEPHLCRRLRQLVAQTYAANREVLESDVVIPVPLHPARKHERGFNQAEVIARRLAADFHIHLDTQLLRRAKNTERHRAGMDEVDRAKSVERAFQVTEAKLIKNSSMLLIDDVFTTGHTLSAATRALLNAGAKRVNVITVARVVK